MPRAPGRAADGRHRQQYRPLPPAQLCNVEADPAGLAANCHDHSHAQNTSNGPKEIASGGETTITTPSMAARLNLQGGEPGGKNATLKKANRYLVGMGAPARHRIDSNRDAAEKARDVAATDAFRSARWTHSHQPTVRLGTYREARWQKHRVARARKLRGRRIGARGGKRRCRL